ncbi:MAG: retroviral-like aspartic protease family protein [Janthinobacterium lividum]
MWRIASTLASFIFCAFSLHAQAETLCDAHDWFAPTPPRADSGTALLCKGVLDSSLEHRKQAAAELQKVIGSAPQSPQAFRAHEVLTSMYFRAGQYREALKELDECIRLRPNDKDLLNERPLIVALSAEPDQRGKAKYARLARTSINDGNPHFPVKVNGKTSIWFMDTGANISLMSDAEAIALGLQVVPVETKMDDISGSKTAIKVALVPDLLIGRTHLKHVGFVVLPHTQPPFDDIPTDQQALLGIQVLRALGSIRVDRIGQVDVGGRATTGEASRLAFDDNTPVVEMATGGRSFAWTFDTGAVRTTLNQPFAAAFPEMIAEGKQKDYKLTGVGGSTQQRSVELSRVQFTLGGKEVALAPATVLLNQTTGTSTWAAGNLGFDLIRQAVPFTIDFQAMVFRAEP